MSEMLDAAVRYASMGWAVHALEECSKEPATKRGFKDATTNVNVVRKLWTDYPNCNVSIATGAASGGVIVIDMDVDDENGKNGIEWVSNWEDENGKLPETVGAVTGRGGYHLFFRTDRDIKCSVNKDIGVDVRGNGGYAMVAPSRHPNGNVVYWDLSPDEYEVAWANDTVYALIEDIQKGSTDDTPFEVKEKVMKGERDVHMYRFCCSQRAKSVPKDVCIAAALQYNSSHFEPPMSELDVRAKVSSAYRNKEGLSDEAKAIRKSAKQDNAKQVSINGIMLASKRGSVQQTTENHMRVLVGDQSLAGRFKYNAVSYSREAVLPLPWDGGTGARVIRDTDYINFNAYCEKFYGLVSKQKATDAVISVAESSSYNPVTDYLDGLSWDGTDRVSTVLSVFLGAAVTDYNATVSRLLFLGAVARAYDPGCKFDFMPVLVGSQGQGKSYFVSKLAVRHDWYLDNLSTFQGDAAVEKIRGAWIVEVAELAAMKGKAEVEAIKAFVTTRYDTIRPKYARETEQRPRTCVLVGTTNEHGFLTDLTGNRRYLPVQTAVNEKLLDMFDDSVIEPYIEQCWAQAVHEYRQERPALVIPPELMETAEQIQSDHMEDDPIVGIVQAYLDDIAKDARNIDKRVCLAQIAESALGVRRDDYIKDKRLGTQLSRVMRNHISGWEPCDRAYLGQEWGRQRAFQPIGWGAVQMMIDAHTDENGQMFGEI